MATDQIEALLTQLGDKDGGTRQRARETLAAIGESAVPSLTGLLGSPEARLRWEAAKALTEIPDPAAIPGLVSLLAAWCPRFNSGPATIVSKFEPTARKISGPSALLDSLMVRPTWRA